MSYPEYNDNDAEAYERPACTVILPCSKDRVSEEDVEFLDIEEDAEGRDVLTFTCPQCGETHKSLRFG